MKKTFYLFILFFSFYFVLGQNKQYGTTSQIEAIDIKLKEITKEINEHAGDPKQQEEQLFHLKSASDKLKYDQGILQSGSLIMLLYTVQDRNRELIKLGSELKKVAHGKEDPYGYISNIYRRNALALGYLGLNDASIKDFRTAIKFIQTIKNKDKRLYYLSLCYDNITAYYENGQFESKFADSILYFRKKSLDAAKQISDNNGNISNDLKYDQIAFGSMAIGISYLSKEDTKENIALAEKYLLEGLKIHKNEKYNIPPKNKIIMLNQASWLYSEKQDYQKSIHYALHALELEKKFRSPYSRMESFEFLTDSYISIGDKEKSKFYMDKYNYLKDSLNTVTKNNADVTMKNLVAHEVNEQKAASKNLLTIMGILIIIATIIISLLWRRKNKNLHKKYEQMISTISSKKENSPIKSSEIIRNKENKGSTGIPNDTAKSLLQKLEKFEASEKYLKKEASLTWLANNLNTNTKYLSEIIKIERGKNFSNYINGLRINYIVDKLYNNPKYREYKISHLIEESGFVTHKVFVAAFKNEHGVTPSYFIEKLKQDERNLSI
ncbi:helix-turn-helix domain-containing protein [Chryseobacterium sp. 2987]|uniref:helix-turn-helix domain-containing protein n=1 Tax=unclassified Chryseobacterium TaxID=2593645 RepID=UPI00285E8477|nr:helix-turn-helix domain-containing protein [Chryseobacterium sp. 2987]MDR6919260.1 YesN/AraC family two-component response regulator [Chryseobacterium sp. 2987]